MQRTTQETTKIELKHFIYDAVHGYIGLTDQEDRIVNTRVFQRLHHIKQLGSAYLVYPGATHSRFSHSLGTMFVMGRIAQRLFDKKVITDIDEIKKLRLAALMHDLGHFPFSHCLEHPIIKAKNGKGGNHEDLSVHLINNTSIRDFLAPYEPEEITSLITKRRLEQPLYSLLISSDLDADRIDYLMRDAHETGVSYGSIDFDRLVLTLRTDQQQHLAVEDRGRQALENFLLSRYHMYQVVYYHRRVVGFELMLERIYYHLLEQGLSYNYEQICTLSEDELYYFNDGYVLKLIREHEKCCNVGKLISNWKEGKCLSMVKEVQFRQHNGQEQESNKLAGIELQSHLSELSTLSGVPDDWIFYRAPKVQSILSTTDEDSIHVLKEDGESISIAEDPDSIISTLCKSNFLCSRIYTTDEYEEPLKKGIERFQSAKK